jgi:transposase
MERTDVDLLFRWCVGLGIDDAVWDASTFAKKRDRFLEMDAAAELLAGVVKHPEVRRQMSRDHFSVDGTLIDALPRPAGRVSFGDRMEGLLAFDGRR